MFGSLGLPELLFIFALALVIFGPKRLPQVGRTLGRGMAEFRKASTELRRTINTELMDEEVRSADPRKIVRDSLRDVKQGLDESLKGKEKPAQAEQPAPAPAAETPTVDEPPPPAVAARGAVARGSVDPEADVPTDDVPTDDVPTEEKP